MARRCAAAGATALAATCAGSTPRATGGSRRDIVSTDRDSNVSTDRDSNLLSIINNWRGPVGIGGEHSLHEASPGRAGPLAA
jgi:hypothetical protein